MATKRKRRKRRRSPGQPPVPPAPKPPPRPKLDEPPPPPWGSFPLSEIAVFVGVVLLVGGFFVPPPQGFVMIAVGLVIGSLAGLELSVREHYAGYRSHTLVLSAAVGVPIFGVLFAATMVPVPICLAAGAVAFGGSAWLFTQAFRRRSGGAPFRFRG